MERAPIKTPPPASHRGGAFTLVETIISLLILAIAATLVVPMFSRTDASRLRAAATLLVADLEFAQAESMTHGDALRVVVFDAAAHSYRIATASSPGMPITLDKRPYVTTFGAGRAASLAGVTIAGYALGGDDRVRFGVYGQLDQATPATITLACGPRRITLTLDPATGAASVGRLE